MNKKVKDVVALFCKARELSQGWHGNCFESGASRNCIAKDVCD